MKPPRTRLLGHVTGLAVYLVDGEHVRNDLDVDFVFGGNEAVYPNYIPKNEIWIDDATSPLDRTATLLHEIVERNLMINKGWSYERAHDAASAAEKPFRRELKKNPPKTVDLNRAATALHALDPKSATSSPAKKPSKHVNPVEREYPKVAAVGRRKNNAQLERECQAFLARRK